MYRTATLLSDYQEEQEEEEEEGKKQKVGEAEER